MKFKLPPGSRICDGGGYRGRFGVVTRDDYYAMVKEILDIPETHCVNVLGEAETATNLFDDALRRHVKGLPPRKRTRPVPPWSRVLAMNIDDLSPLPDGEVGLLAHWDLANVPTVLAVITDNLGYTTDNGTGCEMVGRAKIENGKVSPLPDEERTMGPMGDSGIFRMLEAYTNFSIDLKMRFAKDLKVEPAVREEIEARPGSVASCPQVVDEILVAQADKEAAQLRDESLKTFKDQTERPLEWYVKEAEKQKVLLEMMRRYSPIDGTVSKLEIGEGEVADPARQVESRTARTDADKNLLRPGEVEGGEDLEAVSADLGPGIEVGMVVLMKATSSLESASTEKVDPAAFETPSDYRSTDAHR